MGYFEYGNFENCKFDSDLKSKILWLVTSKKSDGKFEFNFENGNFELIWPPLGWGGVGVGGWLVMIIGDAMTPFYPPFYPVLPRFSFEIAIFKVKFEVTVPFFRSNKPLNFRN